MVKANGTELARFEACATGVGAEFIERFLMDTPVNTVARFHRRGAAAAEDPWHDQVRAIVATSGGDEMLTRCHAALERLLTERPNAVEIVSAEGAIDETYRALIESLN